MVDRRAFQIGIGRKTVLRFGDADRDMAEALLLSLVGGGAGAALAYGLFNGYQAATLNFQTFSQVAFSFAVTPDLLIQGTVFALVMGFIGGFFPAFKAARLPVATALRRV